MRYYQPLVIKSDMIGEQSKIPLGKTIHEALNLDKPLIFAAKSNEIASKVVLSYS
jgi:hypothetical protein